MLIILKLVWSWVRCNLIGLSCTCLLLNSVPDTPYHLFITHLFKNTITSHQNKIMVVLELKRNYLWITNNHLGVTSVLGVLCFNITKSPWDRELTRKYSHWSLNVLILMAWNLSRLCESLSSIYLTTSRLNSLSFSLTSNQVYDPWIGQQCDCHFPSTIDSDYRPH